MFKKALEGIALVGIVTIIILSVFMSIVAHMELQ